MTTHAQPRSLVLSPARLILFGLTVFGLVAAAIRYIYGLGAVSNMNNSYAFGMWISFDLLCGVATAAGAFMTCAAVYILGREEFRPLVRPAVLTGFLGYLAVILALLVDLGRPERIWHMIIYWNPHSPLFEIGLCVMTYTTVLFFEFSPVAFEWLKWSKAAGVMKTISLFFVILGTVLSTLHQSSLGSLFLMMSDKINPLWHSPLLPLFFFVSAATVGLAMVLFESSISSNAYGRLPEVHLLGKFGKALPWFLGAYLALKLGDLAFAGELKLTLQGGWQTILWWVEILGGVVTPIILFSLPAIRRSARGLFISALFVILGLMLNRFNIGLLAWTRPAGSSYFPHVLEFAVSFGVISGMVLVYDFVARHMRLFDVHEH